MRPVCPFYGTRRGCRKSSKCPLLHADNSASIHLPHISRCEDEEGHQYLVLRPPLAAAWEKFFEEKGKPNCLSFGRQIELEGCPRLIHYTLLNMRLPNLTACEAAKQLGGVRVDGQWYGQSGKECPKHLCHGTSIDNALSILLDGSIDASPGICGAGIYAFGLGNADSDSELVQLFLRGCSGGYNSGAMIVMKLNGVLVKTTSNVVVPSGSCGTKNDQFSASPDAVTYVSIVFNLDGIVHKLGNHLDKMGFTLALYEALQKAKEYIADASTGKSSVAVPVTELVLLENQLVSKSNKKDGRKKTKQTLEDTAGMCPDEAPLGEASSSSSHQRSPATAMGNPVIQQQVKSTHVELEQQQAHRRHS